uniref:C2H2-type domain-containing protein n=1 Tax=Anopheles epiroticus TaxID=199890 RepID=A0A182P1G1_9DIPT
PYELEIVEDVLEIEKDQPKYDDTELGHDFEEEADALQQSWETETTNVVPDAESKSSLHKLPDHRFRGKKGKRGRPKLVRVKAERTKLKQLSDKPLQKQRPMPKICTICGVARTDMAAHMRWHNNERPYQCPHCPKIFLNSSNLKNHINLHTREKMYKCDLCDKEFPSTTGRAKHRETHATERTHLCAVCGKSFKYQASLARHKLIHFEEPKEKCPVCDMIFLTKTRLSKHFMVHMDVKPFSCEVCSKAFNRKDNLKTHMKTHAKSKKRDEPVIERMHSSRYEPGVPKEEVRAHTKLEDERVCDYLMYEVLGMDSETENVAITDTETKGKERRKRTFCTICRKYLHNMAEHRRMHLNIRLHQCPYCEKTFVYRANMTAHLNIHTHDRIYKCEQCGSEFTSMQGLKQHRLMHFEAQYACSICNRKYSRKSYLHVHRQRVHMPKQKQSCSLCDRQFQNPTLFEEHMKLHDTTLHECSVCHRAYKANKNLLRHIRSDHPEEWTQRSSGL